MSFPPRHPMMRGMMMPQFGPYPPMGMMQMGMMPMPNMMPPIIRNPIIQKEPVINQAALNSIHEEKLPVTTVFVGNIHEKAPDIMIKCMLGKCGSVTNWKRVQGTTGKLQAFGFCEYDNPESTLRCIRTLNDLQILDKKLLVKVDANTNTLLEEYKSKRSDKTSSSREEKEKDAEVLKEIQAVLKEYEGELNRIIFETSTISTSTTTSTSTSTTSKTKLSVVEETDKKLQSLKTKQKHNIESGKFAGDEMDDEIQSLVSKEIRSFRDAHLNSEKEESREKSSKSDRARSRREERERDRLREREREREKNREREREREKEREREREKEREREAERERERQERRHSRSKTRDLSPREEAKRLNDDEDNEEVYERKKLERRLRDKEAAYQELLRKWESRERKKIREHDKEKQREKERRVEENKESKRLREFLEDYNDERDDVKYYKGSALQQRLFERQKEMDSDDRDRQREVEEVEDIRRKLQEEGRDDVEEEIARIEREREQHLLPGIPMAVPTHTSPQASYSPGVIVLDKTYSPTNNHQDTIIRAEVEDEDVVMISENGPDKNNTFSELDKYQDPPQTSAPISTEGLSSLSNYTSDTSNNEEMMNNEDSNPPHPSPSQTNDSTYSNEDSTKKNKRKLTVHEAFKPEEEVEKSHKKQKLIPLNEESNSSDGKGLSAEEKRKWIKSFIDQIPVEKDNLFAWEVDWSLVDNSLIEKRIKPWVNKKIVEYIGEDEPALSDFICKKVLSHTPPDTILSDISLVLDDEAEVFVMKMWRLLVYEIEAKKCGVIK